MTSSMPHSKLDLGQAHQPRGLIEIGELQSCNLMCLKDLALLEDHVLTFEQALALRLSATNAIEKAMMTYTLTLFRSPLSTLSSRTYRILLP
jgi:hypothetical protein